MVSGNPRRVFSRPGALLVVGLVLATTLLQTAVCIPIPVPVPGFTWVVGDPSDLDDCHVGAWGQLLCPN